MAAGSSKISPNGLTVGGVLPLVSALLGVPADGRSPTIVLAVAVLALALLARYAARGVGLPLPGPRSGARVARVLIRTRPDVYARQRDPDAAGRTRPRAPSAW